MIHEIKSFQCFIRRPFGYIYFICIYLRIKNTTYLAKDLFSNVRYVLKCILHKYRWYKKHIKPSMHTFINVIHLLLDKSQ